MSSAQQSKFDPLIELSFLVSFEDLDDSTPDDSAWGADPFDVVAAKEEELGAPLRSNNMSG